VQTQAVIALCPVARHRLSVAAIVRPFVAIECSATMRARVWSSVRLSSEAVPASRAGACVAAGAAPLYALSCVSSDQIAKVQTEKKAIQVI
jgi:fatty acid/phospholipid biosynthesis enzyme